jgi:hypothetical protein
VHGTATVGEQRIEVGDGLAIVEQADLQIELGTDSEVLWFDLPGRATH